MLKELLSVKKLIAILLTAVFCILSLKGLVSSSEFLTVFTMVISFYFGHSVTRQAMIDGKSPSGELPQGDPEVSETINMNVNSEKQSQGNKQITIKHSDSK